MADDVRDVKKIDLGGGVRQPHEKQCRCQECLQLELGALESRLAEAEDFILSRFPHPCVEDRAGRCMGHAIIFDQRVPMEDCVVGRIREGRRA